MSDNSLVYETLDEYVASEAGQAQIASMQEDPTLDYLQVGGRWCNLKTLACAGTDSGTIGLQMCSVADGNCAQVVCDGKVIGYKDGDDMLYCLAANKDDSDACVCSVAAADAEDADPAPVLQ